MAMYDYRCPECGTFTVQCPMGSAAATSECPACAATARRVFGAPALRGADPGTRRALDAQERSRHEPQVVTGPLPPKGAPYTRNPLHHKLPRP